MYYLFIFVPVQLIIEMYFIGQFGIPKPWYFPFTMSYWTGRDTRKIFVSPTDDMQNESMFNIFIEYIIYF